jgi:hypothetical protein
MLVLLIDDLSPIIMEGRHHPGTGVIPITEYLSLWISITLENDMDYVIMPRAEGLCGAECSAAETLGGAHIYGHTTGY